MTETPYYEVLAHTAGESGKAAMKLLCNDRQQVLDHLRWWQGDYDVLAYHVTEDGRTRIYPNGEAA